MFPIVPPDLANGAKIYNQECAQCHGARGMGDGPQAAEITVPVATLGLSDYARLYSPAEWYTIVSQGNLEKFMPPFANLTDRQRWDVVAYAMSLSLPDELVAQGKSLYQQNCASCHGQTGTGNGSNAANLSTQPKDLTKQSLMAQNSASSLYQVITSGIAPDMPAYTNILDENQRWALVGYLRTLTFTLPIQAESSYPSPVVNAASTSSANTYPASETSPIPLLTQNPQVSTTAEISQTVPAMGPVEVQLINGSGGEAPSDVPVTLLGIDDMGLESMQNTYSETLTAGINGVYTFTNVLMPAGRVFLAGTDYASGTYSSDAVTADPAVPDLKMQITVYDSTTDTSSLTTDRVHILFDFTDPQYTQVIEVFIISNSSMQAVVAPTQGGPVVTFPLPKDYTDLQFQYGELGDRFIEVEQGFADKMAVKPGVGNYQVIFYFQLPYNRKLDFIQPMFLPTSAVVVMVPDNGVKVTSDQLQDGGTRKYQDITYRTYNGNSFIAGSTLAFTLSGNPNKAAASLFSPGTTQSLAIGLGVFGVALVLVGLWLFRRNQSRVSLKPAVDAAGMDTPLPALGTSSGDEDTLMDAIIALDDQYHAGNLPEEAYLERRAVLKDRLREITHG
jgi:mono/diheme cytochrome c family protein